MKRKRHNIQKGGNNFDHHHRGMIIVVLRRRRCRCRWDRHSFSSIAVDSLPQLIRSFSSIQAFMNKFYLVL